MAKGTTQTDESFKMFADVVGAWGFVILKTALPCAHKIYLEDAHHLCFVLKQCFKSCSGGGMLHIKLRLVMITKAPSPFGRRLG